MATLHKPISTTSPLSIFGALALGLLGLGAASATACVENQDSPAEIVESCLEIAVDSPCPPGTAPQSHIQAAANGTKVLAAGQGTQVSGGANVGIEVTPSDGSCSYVCVPYLECDPSSSMCVAPNCWSCCPNGAPNCEETTVFDTGGVVEQEIDCSCAPGPDEEPAADGTTTSEYGDDDDGDMYTTSIGPDFSTTGDVDESTGVEPDAEDTSGGAE